MEEGDCRYLGKVVKGGGDSKGGRSKGGGNTDNDPVDGGDGARTKEVCGE